MEPVICPDCGNDRFEAHVYCSLNLHTESLKLSPGESKDSTEHLSLGAKAPQTAYSCSKCGYTIESLADLNILEITVYVVGNSISKQRQGIVYISSLKKGEVFPPNLGKSGYGQLLNNSWVFTKDAWQKARQDPSFRLSDSQYTVNVKDLS